MTLLSRITGLARESLKASVFGAGAAMDAFEAAFRLPNILRRLFAEGAFSQAFVPVLAEYHRQRGEDATRELVGKVGTILMLVLLAVTAAGVLAAPWLVYLLAGGFARTPGKVELTADMIRIMFPYILFISLTSLAGSVLNVYRRFAIPAFTPVLLNMSVIGAALWLARYVDPPVVALAWGVFIGGVAQLAFQVAPLARIGMLPRFSLDWRDPGVRRVLADVRQAGVGKRYLVQHSAGSGKSNSIAWLSHQLIGVKAGETPSGTAIMSGWAGVRSSHVAKPAKPAPSSTMSLIACAGTSLATSLRASTITMIMPIDWTTPQ